MNSATYWLLDTSLPLFGVHVAEEIHPNYRLHDAVSLDDGGKVPGGLLPGVGQGLHEVAHRLLVGQDQDDTVAHSVLLVNLGNMCNIS